MVGSGDEMCVVTAVFIIQPQPQTDSDRIHTGTEAQDMSQRSLEESGQVWRKFTTHANSES